MAGSKPAIGISIINKLLKLLTVWLPSTPLGSPRLPIAATKPATSDRGNGCRTWPDSRHDELSSAVCKPEAPYGTLSPHTISAAGASAYRPEPSEGVAESRTSSHQSSHVITPPLGRGFVHVPRD